VAHRGSGDIDVGRSASSIDSGRGSVTHARHRVAARSESSVRNAFNARNGVRTRPRNIFPATTNLSGKISNQSGKSSSLSGKDSNLLSTGTSLFSCGQGEISRQQVWNLHRQPCSCKEQACSLSEQGCPAKEQRWNLHEPHCPAYEQAWNFPEWVRPAKKQVWYFPAWARMFVANFVARRDKFGSENKALCSAKGKSQVLGVQKPVCRAQACPAKHPDGYRETLFRRLRT
jgi:hypothetical protein